jgi:phosphatidylinositol alpha-1,6-mannosyltransferase
MAVAMRRRPGAIVAGSGLVLPMAWVCARIVGAKLVVYLHGLDIVSNHPVYRAIWPKFFRHSDLVLVNSSATAQLAQAKGIPVESLYVLNPGTDIPTLDVSAGFRFRERHRLGERAMLLSVGRLTRRKGLAEFVEYGLPSVLRENPDAILVIVGEEAVDALNSSGGAQRERILNRARAAGVDTRVRFLGNLTDSELSEAYQAADVHVFPVLDLEGDVEGFGMVALEAAAHGLASAAFAVGGVPDAISQGTSGLLVPSGDYEGLAKSIASICSKRSQFTGAREFAVDKSWTRFGARARALVRELLRAR